jgi:hypothetical protein
MYATPFNEGTLAWRDDAVQMSGQTVCQDLPEELCNTMHNANRPVVSYLLRTFFLGNEGLIR